MLPTILITLREVIEAALIVATILGILTKLHQPQSIRTVALATLCAFAASVGLLMVGSFLGLEIQETYEHIEAPVEGVLMILSAAFITWAVFVLHKQFAREKMALLSKVKGALLSGSQKGIFFLVFTSVFREGIEIVLFLSTVYLSSNPVLILGGFTIGLALGLAVSFALFAATIRLPLYYAFRVTSILLMLFAAGLLGRGIGELLEIQAWSSSLPAFTFSFIPNASTLPGIVVKTVFGITRSMHPLQLLAYTTYLFLMHRTVYLKSKN